MINRFLFSALLLTPILSFAQPRFSPQVRAEREVKWMQDSLHLSESKLHNIMAISLTYNNAMDSIAEHAGKNKDKAQAKLMKKKDAQIKALLTKQQYQRYYRREQMIRMQDKVKYPPGKQPY